MKLPVKYSSLSTHKKRQVRNQYVEDQKGLCHHCKAPLRGPCSREVGAKLVTARLFPPGFFRWPIHLHHSHETGLTLGAVHCYCNAVLWEHEGE
jgi:hypothetical protein